MNEKTYEAVRAKTVLNRVKAERMPFEWSLNPYRGCAHGCSFCYARSFQSFLGKAATDEFQNHILVKENAAEALEAQLQSFARRFGVRPEGVGARLGRVAIGTATDPYQPVEAKAEQTRRCLRVLAKYRVRTSVTTRSPLIARDVDLLKELRLEAVNISIHTLDAALTRTLEPGAPAPAARLKTVEKLAAAGLPVGVFIAPILPLLTDEEPALDALFAAVKSNGAAFAWGSLLRLAPDVKMWYYRTLEAHFPKLLPRYIKLYDSGYAEQSYAEKMNRLLAELSARHGLPAKPPERADAAPAPSAAPPQPEQLCFQFA